MNELAVIGAGAWGTALAITAARAGQNVTFWARDPERARAMAASRENPRLPGHHLPDAVKVTATLPTEGVMLLAVPLQHLRGIITQLPMRAEFVVCAKGIEQGTLKLPLEIAAGLRPDASACVLTGPNFAHEIAAGLPAASVVAGGTASLREAVTALLKTPDFRLYGNADGIGAQIGGAAKNVIAIAAGASDGAGLGENARAALVTRGLAEMTRMAVALGGQAATVAGLSGLGDLLLTCTGGSSRNYSLGRALGRGEALAAILAARTSVAEGVATAPALAALAKRHGVDMPICSAVAALVTGRSRLASEIGTLLSRPLRDE
jgi:glycerol-3-phosphate dehydrogenase (NAD(P)+)